MVTFDCVEVPYAICTASVRLDETSRRGGISRRERYVHDTRRYVSSSHLVLVNRLTVLSGSPMTPEYAWAHREGRRKRYETKRVGGTVVVHFIKKNMWFLETALALLEGEEYSDFEKHPRRGPDAEAAHSKVFSKSFSKHRRP